MKKTPKQDNGAVCPYLWNHHCVIPTGQVRPCCRVDHKNAKSWDNIKISEGIHSQAHRSARQQMRQGIRPSECSVCWQLEDNGIDSGRLEALRRNERLGLDIDYSTEPKHVHSIDIKFNNTCNLACRMCNPGSSSLVDQLAQQMPQHLRFNNQKHSLGKINFFEQQKVDIIKRHIQQGATLFKTTGGDPFFQPQFHSLLEWCIDHGYNHQLEIEITTNLIGVKPHILGMLKKFKNIKLTVSIDGTEDVYEYIRYPARWHRLTQNLQSYSAEFETRVSCVLQSYNLFNINNLRDHLLAIGILGQNFYVDCQIKPVGISELAVDNLPDSVIQQAINECEVEQVLQYLKQIQATSSGRTQMLDNFAQRTVAYDQARQQSYLVLDPRIIQVIEQHLK